jgi:TetR/AcrR family transcriptional repressor of nem operon
MGIGGASLYNTFGDKHALFVKALERYLNRSVRARLRRLEESRPPKQVMPAFFIEVIERSLSDRSRGGYLLINSALEISPHDLKLGTRLRATSARSRSFCVEPSGRRRPTALLPLA